MLADLIFMLIINFSLIVSFVYILNRIKPYSLNPNSPFSAKVYYSIGFVVLSILVTRYSFREGVLAFDFRFVPIMVAGFFGGPITGSVAGILVGFYFIIWNHSSAAVVLALGSVILGLVTGLFTYYRYRKNLYLLVPALAGTLVVCITGFVVALFKLSLQPGNYALMGLVQPLAFIFMVLLLKDLININEHRKQLEREATLDGMTGLFNFRYFDNSLKEVLESAVRRSEKLAVAFIDIDLFKKVNDTFGHQAGDEVLRQLGEVIRHSLRPFDIAARYGGEEFAAILPGCDSENAIKVGERIRRNVEKKRFDIGGRKINISVSVGVTTFPDYAKTDDDLVRQSDIALYRAKQTGRNKVVSYAEIAGGKGDVLR